MTVGRGLVALLGEVLHLEFQRVHAEVVRQMVQMRLDGKKSVCGAPKPRNAQDRNIFVPMPSPLR